MAHKFNNAIVQKHRILVEVVVETSASYYECGKGIKRGIYRGLDTQMIAAPDKVAVNNAVEYLETYHEITAFITLALYEMQDCVVTQRYAEQGHGGMYELAEEWANEFHEMYADREWDGEWLDTITEFFNSKNELT
jgi:hypothetical protein